MKWYSMLGDSPSGEKFILTLKSGQKVGLETHNWGFADSWMEQNIGWENIQSVERADDVKQTGAIQRTNLHYTISC